MAVDSPTKELFRELEIRTMKKDLTRLREADSLHERKKTGATITTEQPQDTSYGEEILAYAKEKTQQPPLPPVPPAVNPGAANQPNQNPDDLTLLQQISEKNF